MRRVEEGDADENVENVNVGDAAEGDVSAANDEVPTVDEEPSIPSPTLPTPLPQPSHDIPFASHGRMITEMDEDVDVVLEEAKEVAANIAKADQNAKEDESEPAKLQEVVDVVTTAKLITKVVLLLVQLLLLLRFQFMLLQLAQIKQDEQYARELEAELNGNIDWDEVINHVKKKAKEDLAVKRYQVLKRKPQNEAQARKNMMINLKNIVGFKIDYFKGMSYDDIRPIFEAKFDSNVAFLQKTKEQIKEEERRALKRINETSAEKATKRQKLDEEVEELKIHLQIVP
nr:hypothetical protein [Tanacetum cinerariifolium]